MIEDQYTEQARMDTNLAWAYPLDADQDSLERDQAKWEYALEQRAARLRTEAALLHISNTLSAALQASMPLVDLLTRSLKDIQIMLGGPAADKAQ